MEQKEREVRGLGQESSLCSYSGVQGNNSILMHFLFTILEITQR